ncbi:GPH family glycoside/pentoside/hexuronide:cation symporter [Aequitasia blattaphilus]|uniref:Glycoside-pentoside-hexuronide (GPH):cation symporter n=1 Tax=Aequitasia blattaphilus TaxID=2949332 RepID=A0ABT1ECM1_9FIRM|nr:glycoside-pentoside-hexuronide (GPH):cation symporter [Aequitasia blattaphilus]MCP1103583.1 glycoside-pentoside-hexuronide (GPH):cation symporter [Aequitasia blattaphilus]MCR8616223.1 glycoside-pentoside-hexuronide (GPH):cation symporter [Aequitasia blattaphilus]
MEQTKNTNRLTVGTRVAYGFGDTACNIVFGMISTLLTLFYTDYAGVSVATVGLVMLISRIFDGTSDIIMGFIVNKTKSKWGKARPWVLWMSIPYCVSAIALFTVPQTSETLQFWYIFITYNLCTTVFYTAINVPYGTLSTMMTRSSHERDLLSIFRMSMAPIGRIIAVTLTMPIVKLFGDNQAAWVKAMSMYVILAFLMLLICFLQCKETVSFEQREKVKIPFGKNIKALLTNQYFWATLILWTVTCVHGTIVGTSLPYYCKYIFQNDSWMYSALYFAEAGTLVLGAMLCPILLRKMGKRNLSLIGAIIAVVAHALFLLNPGSFGWALGTSIVRALGEAPLTAVVFGMMGDVIEFGQWKTSIRQEALIFGGGSLGFKIGTGITSAVITSLLNKAGYLSSTGAKVVQPDSAISMIKNIYMWGPILVWIVAVIVLLLYKLDNKYPKIMEELNEREARGEM